MGVEEIVDEMLWEPPYVEGRNSTWAPVPEDFDVADIGSFVDEGIQALLVGAAEVDVVMDIDTLRVEFMREGTMLVISAARVEGYTQADALVEALRDA